MTAILYDRTYTDSYLAIKDGRATVKSALDRIKSSRLHGGLGNQFEQCLTVARRVSAAQRRLAMRTRDASDSVPAAESASELDLLQNAHVQRSQSAADAIGPAELDAFDREFRRLLLLITEIVNSMIRLIGRLFGVDLPLIDDEPIRTAVYGNADYRRAKHGDAGTVQAVGDIMQRDYETVLVRAPDQNPAVTSIELIRQVRNCVTRNGGPADLVDDHRRAYLDDLTQEERTTLTHASGNQLVEHLYRQIPLDEVRPFMDRRIDTMTI
ncbi:hypothetical protein [Loktanella sp. M215]|uniref:hypothetical protein n=1 Tax=Loktanella sp. M215 TaxID=2675431 RepID=UPI001F43A8C4|nr:hypothetical protein [Loktanella sp. M215]MCF7702223.1 hypothetical protein [Loktanella sp. M215]